MMNRTPTLAALCLLLSLPAGCRSQGPAGSSSGSRLAINLAGPADWNTEHPFVDVFRLSREWISQREGAAWGQGPPLERDADGWVKRLEPGCRAETPVLTAGHAPDGQYVCLYEGDGDLEFVGVRRVVSRAPGRIVVDIDGARGGVFVSLRRTNPADPVRGIRLIMPGHEATYRAQPFNPAFLARWHTFRAFRFMDWMLTNGSPVREWSQRAAPGYCNFTERGVPAEVMCDLCNRQRMDAWFCMPHRASDDYVRRFAALVKRLLHPSLKVYVEYSNEVWNSGFEQTRYAGDEGLRLGLADKHWEAAWRYSALRSVEVFRLWEEVFGGRERLVRVMASQAANAYVSEQKLAFREAGKACDALAIAPYISVVVAPRGSDGQPGADTVREWSVDRLLDYTEQKALPECIGWMGAQKKVADRYGLKLIAYEAGQHLVGAAGAENDEKLAALFLAANRHERMGAIYRRYLDAWRRSGGDLCALFSSVGAWSKWGSWGLLEYNGDDTPKYRAVMDWNRTNTR